MNKGILIPVIASILILGVLGSAEDAFAPKKLFVGGLSWDTDSQSFVVTGEMNHGMAKAIEKAGFTLSIELTINPITSPIGTITTIFEREDVVPGREDFTVQIQCDPFCDDIIGEEIDVSVDAKILNSGLHKKAVATITPKLVRDIFIDPPPADPPTIDPSSGFAGTPFTITDPQGRMSVGDIALFYVEGTDPGLGTPADLVVSADGTTATGTTPGSLAGALHFVSVRPSIGEDSLFADLAYQVT